MSAGGARGGSDRAPYVGRHPFGRDCTTVSGMGAAGLCLALAGRQRRRTGARAFGAAAPVAVEDRHCVGHAVGV